MGVAAVGVNDTANSACSLRRLARLKYSVDTVDRGSPYASPSNFGRLNFRFLGDRFVCLQQSILGRAGEEVNYGVKILNDHVHEMVNRLRP
jgi:hypothetical protein